MFSVLTAGCEIMYTNCSTEKVKKVAPFLDLVTSVALFVIAAYGFGLSAPASYALIGVGCVEFLFAFGKIYTSCKEEFHEHQQRQKSVSTQ